MDLVKTENKDYLMEGKEIKDILLKIKGYKDNIENGNAKLL